MTYTKDAQQVGTRLSMPTQQGNIRIVKRTGEETSLDISRIREVVQWACAGLGEEGSPNANPIALESALTMRLRDGVTTREIQDNLIDCALQLCSPEESNWRYVAGRLHIWNIWKDIQVLRKRTSPYGSYANVATEKVISGIYSPDLGQYSWKELEEAGKWINPYWDLEYDYAGAVLLSKRYLLDNELPQEALLTCALLLALPEKPEQRLFWARKFYQAIASRKISLATPILANLRVPKGSLSSCFIVAMEDNLESIYREITNTARISKNGGGVGVNVSRIRATGSWVMGNKNASGGVIPWIKLLNDTAIAVNQGGRRAGAVTVGLDIWHLDVPEFLEIQTENGDQRRKAYDVFCQLVVTDEFMRRVKANQSWTLLDPYEVRKKFGIELAELWGGKFDETYRYLEDNLDESPHSKVDLNNPKLTLYQKISAKELFKNIMRSQVETGMPYIAYKDTINKANPNKHEGYIPGVNLCVESFSNVVPGQLAHTCNLNSLNLANIEDEELPEMCRLAVRMLDNTIEITTTPIEESAAHNNRYRTIGVGAMGLADWLAKRRLSYGHLREISRLFEDIGYYCTHTSMELAKERGAYPAFEGSEWSKGKLINSKPPGWFSNNAYDPERWLQLARNIILYGIRNSHILAIAPNTSSSLVQGCTASILPVFSRFFYDKWAKGTVPIAPPFIGDRFWYYKENKTLPQSIVVSAVSEIQKWIDTGISMELVFNLNAGVYFPDEPDRSLKAKDIYDVLIQAWESGCKAIYYIRTVQKDAYTDAKQECASCAN